MRATRCRLLVTLGCVFSSVVACVDNSLVACDDGRLCPVGTACDDRHQTCVDREQLTSCEGREDAYACDAVPSGVCWEGVCIAPGCGNRVTEASEACDDGNSESYDGCSADCLSNERCGNGVLDTGEQCDDGNALSHDGCASQCAVEQGSWAAAQPTSLARKQSASAWDAAHRTLVLFGGVESSPINNTAVWRETGWSGWFGEVTNQPAAATDPAMAFDAARSEVVLFGGFVDSPLGETWAWDGERWRFRATAIAPPARSRHAMAYDAARKQIVLFGGARGGLTAADYFGDTWLWDGSAWSKVSETGPSPRAEHRMAYDPVRGRVLLFGGEVDVFVDGDGARGVYVNDTWAWDGTKWTKLQDDSAANAVSARGRVGLVWDGAAMRQLGGSRFSWLFAFAPPEYYSVPGAFTWDDAQATWIADADASPVYRIEAVALQPNRTLVAHGAAPDGVAETWTRAPGQAWLRQAPTSAPPSTGNSMAFDAIHGEAILATGATTTFRWNGSWSQQNTASPPGPLTFDSVVGQVTALDETFDRVSRWNGTAWATTTLAGPPPNRTDAVLSVDSDGSPWLFGGRLIPGSTSTAQTWRASSLTWQLLSPASPPSARANAQVTADARGIWMFGGFGAPAVGSNQTTLNDLWLWSNNSWQLQTTTAQIPSGRTNASLTSDLTFGRLLLFGGLRTSNSLSDTWEWNGTDWNRVLGLAPQARANHAAVYDPIRHATLIHGGSGVALDPTWAYRLAASVPSEVCAWGRDLDGDGLVGCADPDCWGTCTPLCPPGVVCPASSPRCGDDRCDAPRESGRLCSECPIVTLCGDFFCDPSETAGTCPGDCN